MDSEEKLVSDSQVAIAVAVLVGRNDAGEPTLNLVNLDEQIPFEAGIVLAKQGCCYVGVIVYRHDGTVDSMPADYQPGTVQAMLGALPHFVNYAAPRVVAKMKSDSEEWLQKLMSLPDTRTN
jgi:hypothetical protein